MVCSIAEVAEDGSVPEEVFEKWKLDRSACAVKSESMRATQCGQS